MTFLLSGTFQRGAWPELVRNRRADFVVSKAKLFENSYHDLRGGSTCFLDRDALGKPKSVAQRAFNTGIAAGRFIRVHISQVVALHCISPLVCVRLRKEAYGVGNSLDTRKRVDFRVMPSAAQSRSSWRSKRRCGHD